MPVEVLKLPGGPWHTPSEAGDAILKNPALDGKPGLQYPPLPSRCFRLLKTVERSATLVRLTMHSFPVSSPPGYVALSYTWGSAAPNDSMTAERNCPVICDGQIVHVTENLWIALRAINVPGAYMWADGLCINQEDVSERSSQVALMGHIYSNASQVLVWLGPDDEKTWQGCQVVQALAPRLHSVFEEEGPNCMHGCAGNRELWIRKLGRREFHEEEVHALNHLFARRWLERLWVIQEVVLAKKISIACGSSCFEWVLFETMALFLATSGYSAAWVDLRIRLLGTDNPPFMGGSVMAMATLKSCFDSGNIPVSERGTVAEPSRLDDGMLVTAFFQALETLIVASRSAQATMSQDKVFAPAALLLHKFSDRIAPETFQIDYALPTRTLYIDTCTKIINHGKRLSLLSYVEDRAFRKLEGLPSWVPDLSIGLIQPLVSLRDLKGGRFKCLTSGPTYAPSASDGKLIAQGYHLDALSSIVSSSRGSGGYTGPELFTEAATLWLQFALSLETSYLTGESALEAFIRTILADQVGASSLTDLKRLCHDYLLSGLLASPELDDILRRYRDQTGITDSKLVVSSLCRMLCLNPDNCPSWPVLEAFEEQYGAGVVPSLTELVGYFDKLYSGADPLNPRRKPDYLSTHNRHLRSLMGRRLFKSQRGYIGLSPESAVEGDEIWLVCDSDVPLVLRPAGEPGTHVLVGPAYVHGVMYGELDVQKLGDLVSLTVV